MLLLDRIVDQTNIPTCAREKKLCKFHCRAKAACDNKAVSTHWQIQSLLQLRSNDFYIAHFNTLCFTFLWGFLPREIENNDYAKFLGGKQSVLWAMWEWQIDKSKERVRSRGHCPSFRLGFVFCTVRLLHGSRETGG